MRWWSLREHGVALGLATSHLLHTVARQFCFLLRKMVWVKNRHGGDQIRGVYSPTDMVSGILWIWTIHLKKCSILLFICDHKFFATSCLESVKTKEWSFNHVLLLTSSFSSISCLVVRSTIPGTLARSMSLPCMQTTLQLSHCMQWQHVDQASVVFG